MKQVKYVMLLAVVSITSLVFTGCEKQMDEVVPQDPNLSGQEESIQIPQTKFGRPPIKEGYSEYGLLAYPNGVITIEDFKKTGKLLTREEAKLQIDKKLLGASSENAIVQPFFHSNGVLYTPHEFNLSDIKLSDVMQEDLLEGSDIEQWTIDLKTFQEVTGLKEATGDYARDFGVWWIFDPYVKFYETREEKENLGKK